MKKLALTALSVFFIVSSSNAGIISLEQKGISAQDRAAADNIRDNTQSPNSFIGGAIQHVGKAISEGTARHSQACSDGKADYVTVDFDVVAGLSTEGVDRVFSISPVDRATGRSEQNAVKTGATIFKSSSSTVAGYYRWSASWDRSRKTCSGKVYLSGTKCTAMIRIYTDCRDAGSSEF